MDDINAFVPLFIFTIMRSAFSANTSSTTVMVWLKIPFVLAGMVTVLDHVKSSFGVAFEYVEKPRFNTIGFALAFETVIGTTTVPTFSFTEIKLFAAMMEILARPSTETLSNLQVPEVATEAGVRVCLN